ncbi:hypothetical protein J6590_075570 [Homalodisca vitripennis]|nr:hypothetical protein J6590_093651 [Homalodisca vitripennis]KAG8329921.1 hypothetical protein J6590_075570 [Homalodisca vitripennis]
MKLAASKSKYEDLLKHHDDSLIDKFLVIADDIRIINSSDASSDYILKNAKSMAESLTKNDTEILIVGTNVVSNCTPRHDRPAVTLPGHLLRFTGANQYTNWVVVSLPHRFDLPPRCYNNKLVNQVNHRLKSLTKERIKVIDSRRLERKHFT